jgi:hypothetical protein
MEVRNKKTNQVLKKKNFKFGRTKEKAIERRIMGHRRDEIAERKNN